MLTIPVMMNLKFVISIKTLVPDNIITQEITVIKFDFIEKSFIKKIKMPFIGTLEVYNVNH
jgi:hypothetical protein